MKLATFFLLKMINILSFIACSGKGLFRKFNRVGETGINSSNRERSFVNRTFYLIQNSTITPLLVVSPLLVSGSLVSAGVWCSPVFQ